jgi:hypothetical protein
MVDPEPEPSILEDIDSTRVEALNIEESSSPIPMAALTS